MRGQKLVDEGIGTSSCVTGSRPCVLDKPLDNLSCGTGAGMAKAEQAMPSAASHWSTAAAAGILTELIFLISVSERIDLKSTLR